MNAKEPDKNFRRWGWALTFGVLFEFALFVASAADFQGAFFVEVHNVALAIHYPLFAVGRAFENSETMSWIWLVVYEATLVFLWSCIFNGTWKYLQRQLARRGFSRGKKLIAGVGIAVVVVTPVAWEVIDSHFDQPTPYMPSVDVKWLVEGNNAFALDLYQRLKAQPDNLFFSPYSISAGMGMVYAGARVSTERELGAALHFNLPQNSLHPAFGQLAARLNSVQHWRHVSLQTANSLWYQEKYTITPAFINLVRANYQGEALPVDFKQAAPDAAREMAAWIEKKTGGRLKNAFDPALLTPETRLALCNAVYFKGRWASEFRSRNTNPGPFSIGPQQTVTVPLMYQKGEFKMVFASWGGDIDMRLLELPYYGRDLSMIILLPEEVDGLPELERQLDAARLRQWLAQLDQAAPRTTHVTLPRFTFTRNIDLAKELKGMGVNYLFGDADLSGMESTTNLYVSDVIHQAFIDVNEHGTEAAAMTLALAKSKSAASLFVADHPFIFLIRDNASGSILFLGRLVDPTKS